MEKFKQLQKIKEVYTNGGNIIHYLKSIGNNEKNTIEDILISYDFQSGSYIQSFSKNREYNDKYGGALAALINEMDDVQSLMEVGVGEATTFNTVIRHLRKRPKDLLGFDISWSRMKFAKELLKDFNIHNPNLFTANLFEIPLMDDSIDVVYTSHSIEPNGGKEEEALKELYRIAKKYLILLEPAYEFANRDAKARMRNHGYVTDLYATAKRLGYKVIQHRLFEHSANPLNPTGLLLIEKKAETANEPKFVCPISQTELRKHGECLMYSSESFLAYPIIENIPCLLKENSILATHLLTDYTKFKEDHRIDF